MSNDTTMTIDETETKDPHELTTFMYRTLVGILVRRPDLIDRYFAYLPIAEWKGGNPAYVVALIGIREYIGTYGKPPSPEGLYDFLLESMTAEDDPEFLAEVRGLIMTEPDPRDVPRVEKEFAEFALRELRNKISIDLVEGIEDKTIPELREKLKAGLADLDKAEGGGLTVADPDDGPVDPATAKQPAYSKMLAAPWDLLNEEIGGIRSGEICALTGVTGSGKSLYLQEICVQLVRRGQNVLLVDFENDVDDIVVSHALALVKSPFKDLTYGGAQTIIKKARADAEKAGQPLGKLDVWPTRREMDATAIMETVLRRERELGITFDAVVVDYWDYLTNDEQMQVYRSPYIVQAKQLRLFGTYLRHMGKCAYVGFQTNREGARKKAAKEQVTSADVSGSFQKIMQVQLHMMIERGEGNTSRLRIDKCRRSGRFNGGDVCIEYEYHAAPTKTVSRGYVQETGVKRVDAKGRWLAKKQILLDAVRKRELNSIKGMRLHVELRDQALHAMKIGVLDSEFKAWLDDLAVYREALDNLYDEARIVGFPTRIKFAGKQLAWIIFDDPTKATEPSIGDGAGVTV